MNGTTERRSEGNSDFRRVYDQISGLTSTVNNNHLATMQEIGKVNSAFQVHVVEDKAVADKVREHEEKWRGVDRLKNRGLIYAIGAFIAAGGLGGGAAHFMKKFFE